MLNDSIELAASIRELSVGMVHRAKASHIGGALSMADILAVLYAGEMRYDPSDPSWEGRDRLVISKGHCCVSYYSALALSGYFPVSELESYGRDGSLFLSHVSHHVRGVEFSAGSLGHGLPIAAGLALAAKRKGERHKVFVILGDGEMDEGSNWEALLFAAQHSLDNLCAIIDCNKIQSLGSTREVMDLEPLEDKVRAFNCRPVRVDGHDHDALRTAFRSFRESSGSPFVLIADTVKGKGVSFMENSLAWHYKSPDDAQYEQAIKEIRG